MRIRDYGLLVTGSGHLVRVCDGAVVSVPVAPPLAQAALPPPSEPTPVPRMAVGSNPPESAVPAPAFAPPAPRRVAPSSPPPLPRPPPPRPRAPAFPRRAHPLPPPAPDPEPPDTVEEDERTEPTQVDSRPRLDLAQALGEPTVIDSEPAGALDREPLPRLSRRLARRKT